MPTNERNPLMPVRPMVMVEHATACLQCGTPLPRSRSDRRFCSKVCAMHFARWRQSILTKEKKVKRVLAEIADYGSYPQFVDAQATMANLYKAVDYWTKIVSKRQADALLALDADGQ